MDRTKKEIIQDTVELLRKKNASVVRPIEVCVGIYRGCRKIGYSRLVWESDGIIYCVVKLLDEELKTFTGDQLNGGNILRIYKQLWNYGEEISGI